MNTKNSFTGCDNKKISFTLDGDSYVIPRKEIEEKLNLYWFGGNLYPALIDKIKSKPDWISEYKKNAS